MLHNPYRFGASLAAQLIASVYTDTEPSGSAAASFSLINSGMAAGGPVVSSGSGSFSWYISGAMAASFEVDVTVTAGFFSSGPTGTSNMGTNRTWTVTNTVPGTTNSCAATFVIRPAGGGAALATASITLSATINAGSGGGGDPGGGGGDPPGGGGGILN